MSVDIVAGVCPKLPADFLDGCNDFLGLYLGTVLDMTFKQFAAEGVCENLHVCNAEKCNMIHVVIHQYTIIILDRAIERIPTSEKSALICESCKGITSLMRRELADQTLRTELEHGIEQFICKNLPSSMSNLVCINSRHIYPVYYCSVKI